MSLFFDVLSAINNPDQQASMEQLAAIANTVQQVAQTYNIQPEQMQGILSALGGALGPALQKQGVKIGSDQLDGLIAKLAGSGGSALLEAMISPSMMQQLSQIIGQKTGISPNIVQSALPQLLPAVMRLLNMGMTKPGIAGGNPLLNAFLDADREGNMDLGDVFKFAGRFLRAAA